MIVPTSRYTSSSSSSAASAAGIQTARVASSKSSGDLKGNLKPETLAEIEHAYKILGGTPAQIDELLDRKIAARTKMMAKYKKDKETIDAMIKD